MKKDNKLKNPVKELTIIKQELEKEQEINLSYIDKINKYEEKITELEYQLKALSNLKKREFENFDEVRKSQQKRINGLMKYVDKMGE